MRLPSESILYACVCIAVLLVCRAGAETDDLTAFREKMAEALSAQRADENSRKNSNTQFEALGRAIKHGDYDRAQQLLQSIGGYGIPPELQEEWQELADELAERIVALQQEAAISWKKSVDDVAAKTREACANAKSSADLDEVMVQIAALQIRRVSSNNLLVQRASQKLEGVARFVDQWSRFLDFRDAGDARQANSVLRNLIQNGSDYPVLPMAEIEKAMTVEKVEITNLSDAIRAAFENVSTVDDLPAAVARMEEIVSTPQWTGRGASPDPKEILILAEADRQVMAGDFAGAEQSLRKLDSSNIYTNGRTWLEPIRNKITAELVAAQMAQITGATLQSGESVRTMLARVLDKLKTESKYADMAGIIARASELRSSTRTGAVDYPWSNGDAIALAAFASASQFDQAGDVLAAVNEYREVITSGQGGKYAPTAEAQQALERLRKSNPEAFTDVNGVVIEELRQIRREMNQALRAQMMRGGSPPRY